MLRHPGKVLLAAILALIGTFVAYGSLGSGTTCFPSQEPEVAQVQITLRDNLSVWEKDALVRRVEERVTGIEGIEYVYARTLGGGGGASQSQGTIGVLQLDFLDWDQRRPAVQIIEEVRARTADIAGIGVQVQEQQGGPSQGKPVQLRLTGPTGALFPAAEGVRAAMDDIGGFTDIDDNLPRPGVEWRLAVDRPEAARFGADTTTLGQVVQMLTTGSSWPNTAPTVLRTRLTSGSGSPQISATWSGWNICGSTPKQDWSRSATLWNCSPRPVP